MLLLAVVGAQRCPVVGLSQRQKQSNHPPGASPDGFILIDTERLTSWSVGIGFKLGCP